jgi:hypothetical protein
VDCWDHFGQQWQREGLPGLRLGAEVAFGASGHVRAEGDWAMFLLDRFGDRRELEAFGKRFGLQTGQFQFGAFLFELGGSAVHPGLTFGEQPVDQDGQVAGHGFDRRSLTWQLPAEMSIAGPEVALAVKQS